MSLTLHQLRVKDIDLELGVHLMSLQTGCLSMEVDLPHLHIEVLGESPTRRKSEIHRIDQSCSKFGHAGSQLAPGDNWSATVFKRGEVT